VRVQLEILPELTEITISRQRGKGGQEESKSYRLTSPLLLQAEGAGSLTSLEFALHHKVRRTQLVEAMNAARRLHYNVSLRRVHEAFKHKLRAQSLLRSFLSNTLCQGRTLLHKSQSTQVRQRLTTHLSACTL
jgi:hypothetical protein